MGCISTYFNDRVDTDVIVCSKPDAAHLDAHEGTRDIDGTRTPLMWAEPDSDVSYINGIRVTAGRLQ